MPDLQYLGPSDLGIGGKSRGVWQAGGCWPGAGFLLVYLSKAKREELVEMSGVSHPGSSLPEKSDKIWIFENMKQTGVPVHDYTGEYYHLCAAR